MRWFLTALAATLVTTPSVAQRSSSRGNKGFVAINRESATVSATIPTGLPTGTYCDLLSGGRNGSGCVGSSLVIDAGGKLQLALPSNTGVAIHSGTKL
jgi:alpha-amylase